MDDYLVVWFLKFDFHYNDRFSVAVMSLYIYIYMARADRHFWLLLHL